MTQNEQERVIMMLVATAEVMGHELKPAAAMLMCEDLDGYGFQEVMTALTRCRKEITGKLTLKAIIDLLAPVGGWLSANEAWAQALPAADERNTVVWTVESRKAWFMALPLLESGDKVGARMAFIAAYDREVAQSKSAGATPQQEVSYGDDAELRRIAVTNAQDRGLLPPPRKEEALALPNLSPEKASDNRRKIAEGLRDLAKQISISAQQDREERREKHSEHMREVNRHFDEQRAARLRQQENDDDERNVPTDA